MAYNNSTKKNLTSFADKDHSRYINRKGRPVGALGRRTIYRRHLEAQGRNGELVVDNLVQALIARGLVEADVSIIKELMDGAYGKTPDTMITSEITPELMRDMDIAIELAKHVPKEILEKLACLQHVDNK